MKLPEKAAIEGVDLGEVIMPNGAVVVVVDPGRHGLELRVGSSQDATLADVGRAMAPVDVCGEVSTILLAPCTISWPFDAGEELGELFLWRERFVFEVEVSGPDGFVALVRNGLFHFDEITKLSSAWGLDWS